MIETVAKLVKSSNYSAYKRGMYPRFMQINEKWGFKLCNSPAERDNAHEKQSIGHSIGWGPAVGEKFDLTTPDDEVVYGHITEVAGETLYSRHGESVYYPGDLRRAMPELIKNIMDDFEAAGVV